MAQKTQQRRMFVSIPFDSDNPFTREIDEHLRARNGGKPQPCHVAIQLDEDWIADITLRAQDGVPVVERLTVRHDDMNGAYEDKVRGKVVLAPLPKGGLPLRVLRSLTFGDALKAARASLADVKDETLDLHGFKRRSIDEPRRPPGRRGYSVTHYAQIAAKYVAAVQSGSPKPIEDVAASEPAGTEPTAIRRAVHRARELGLLTNSVRRGVPGGELTAKARDLLGFDD